MTKWITSHQGAELLGVKQPNFFYYVKKGDIAVKPDSKARERLYSHDDAIKIKQRLQARKKRRPKPKKALIDWLYSDDVPAGLRLSIQLYPGEVDLAEAAIYQSWRKNNQYLTMAAFSQDRTECYASIQVVPLVDEQIILDVLAGRREEASIQPEEVAAYDALGPYYLLVTSATCIKERPLLLYQVLRRYIDFWIEQYPERYIRRVYAQAVSESGMKIVQHFFMAPRLDLAPNAFMLDLAYPPVARMIRDFKQRLAEKAPLPPDLIWHS